MNTPGPYRVPTPARPNPRPPQLRVAGGRRSRLPRDGRKLSPESDRQRIEVSQALHLRKAFLAMLLMPAEVAELAQRAAQWLQIWPKDPQDTEEVERLLHAAHDLLSCLRDHALDVAQGQSDVDSSRAGPISAARTRTARVS